MAALMRAKDWTQTSLGPPERWPEALKVAVRILLTSRFEMWLGWGPEVAFLYNDAYRPTLGLKHPESLAKPTRELWAEIWDDVEPRIRTVYEQGEATFDRALLLILQRNGYPEETYHTFSYSPVFGEDGRVGGVFCAVTEDTDRIISERRLGSLQVLASGLSGADTRAAVLSAAQAAAAANPQDLPFSLVYLFRDDGTARLAFTTGFPPGHPAAPEHVDPRHPGAWPLNQPETLVDLSGFQDLPTGAWSRAPANAVVVPLIGQGGEAPIGAMVVGLNPHRPFDEDYIGFLKLFAGQISSSLASADAYEAEHRRATALAEALDMRQQAARALEEVNTRLASEVKLRTAERDRLRALFQRAPGFMCVLRGPDHVFEFMNEAYQQLVGHRDLTGLPVRDALPEIEGQGFFEILDEVYRTGEPFIGRSMPVDIQRVPHGPLEKRFLNLVYQPIVEADGSISGIFAEGHDVTHQRRAEKALRQLNETLEQQVRERTHERDLVWRMSQDLFLLCGFDGFYRSVNPAWQEALGYNPAELVGMSFDALAHPEDLAATRAQFGQLISGQSIRDFDMRMRAKDGSYRWYSWFCVPEGDQFYAAGRDITERKQFEEHLRSAQKMEALGQLTGGVAHDFNNLLQVISGNLQLLAKEVAGNPRAEKRLDNALAGVSRGSKLASQLLAFGRRQPLEPKVVNIGRFIKGMDDMLRRALGEEIEIEAVVSGGLWNTLVDPVQVENVILNLAINARDAMDGHGRLTIEAGNALLDDRYSLQHEVEPGQYVMLAVTDTGCGIPSSVLERVFDPFFSTKPEGKGTGLGLSMVYGFVKQSGGHIKIYSEVGLGTTVKIYLPRVYEQEDVLTDIRMAPVRGGTETILVVEDDDEVRETAVALLTDLGYRVLKSRDAASALSVIESGMEIDLLFTDVVMPGPLRSPELARKARVRLPNIAVLFTSGYTENAIVHGGRLDTGVELLPKPYTREDLARKIRHVLANQQQRNRATTVSFPLRSASTSEPAAGTKTDPGHVVLLVEDDDLIRSSTADMLSELGHRVVQAANATAALQALKDSPADALVTDIGLPDLSGIELARRAKKLHPDLAMIFATGDEGIPKEPDLAAAVLLVKPYTEDDLAQALTAALRGARLGAAD
ncbi:PAS domain-containing protein [Microvirga rosea]|uniref:PAS domain-containing protein n=1 Tax=Microvirga rosea TaxID=2715425 RepID=UPI001D09A551|nr:PAS domain-containing protein [Microvirga rosea]MCB8820478.1 PAS domain-containing protein [Microvirga rosea]